MQELKGSQNTAYVYADNVEQSALGQIHAFLDSPPAAGGRIAIMPDVHAGSGCVIGFTQELGPNPKIAEIMGVKHVGEGWG